MILQDRFVVAATRVRFLYGAFAVLACVLLAFLVYSPYLHLYFIWDDYFFLHAVRDHDFLMVMQRAVTFPVGHEFDAVSLFWRPSIDVYFYAARPLGIHAEPFHIANVALHGLAAGLAAVLLYRLTRSYAAGLGAALLFVIAPTYDFAVTWIAQVSEIVGLVLTLSALISYHAYIGGDRPRIAISVSALALVLALLTKESTAMVAVLLVGLAIVVPADQRKRSSIDICKSLVPFVLVAAIFVAAMGIHEYSQPDHLQSIGLHMPRNLWRYLKWIVLPYRPDGFLHAREALAAMFLIAGVASIVTRQRVLGFLFVWTIAAIVPFIGFDEWIEYRYTYLATLPFVGFVVVGANTMASALPTPTRLPAYGLLGAALVLALIITPLRTRDQQEAFADQSRQYERMVNGVRNLCGPMQPESYVYVLRAPYLDLWGIHTVSAVNLYYHHVHAAAVPDLPALAAFIKNKCVIQYDPATRTYTRTDT